MFALDPAPTVVSFADLFSDCDLDMVDILTIPYR
jgi:hypothetical protein